VGEIKFHHFSPPWKHLFDYPRIILC